MAGTRKFLGMIGLACAPALAACGAGGKAWVQEPESGFTAADPPEVRSASPIELGNATEPAPTTTPEPAQQPSADAPRTRLDHVVSLGDGAAAGATAARDDAGAAPYAGGPVVNIYNVVQPSTLGYGYGYAGYGYAGYGHVRGGYGGYGGGAHHPSHLPATPSSTPSTPSTPALGGSWQPPPSHGPEFPYSTAPASPWR